MRKGISSLCGVVHERMGCSVRNGDVFIFIGSSRKLMKLLHAEDGGLVMYVKRLEAGHFKVPEYDEKSRSYPMEWRDLVIMVEGIRESPGQRLRRLRPPPQRGWLPGGTCRGRRGAFRGPGGGTGQTLRNVLGVSLRVLLSLTH